ncbi:MAG: hypothetical protein KC466_20955, partial [Myxococcales bacterium]|nr:hypothetical protein [Myxococcales bacterium]
MKRSATRGPGARAKGMGLLAIGALGLWITGCEGGRLPGAASEDAGPPDPAAEVLGERLFLETRFAEFFARAVGPAVNAPLVVGDPTVASTLTAGGRTLPGPFAGEAMNCRVCHLVDEHGGRRGGGVRAYADFARRSPIPLRLDGGFETPRNSPSLVGATLPRAGGLLLHLDGEFATTEDLVVETLLGRNYGWLPDERDAAMAHVARVVRFDDGRGDLAEEFEHLTYAEALASDPSDVPDALRLPEQFRLDTNGATDAEIVDAVARLIAAYVEGLRFGADAAGRHVGSPYDLFLRRNGLPRAP